MTVCTPISTSTKNIVCLIGNVQRQMTNRVFDAFSQSHYNCYALSKQPKLHYTAIYASKQNSCSPVNAFQAFQRNCLGSGAAEHNTGCHSLTFKNMVNPRCSRKKSVKVSTGHQNMNLRFRVSKQRESSKIKWNMGPVSFQHRGVSAGIFICLLFCYSSSEPSYAEAPDVNEKKGGFCDASSAQFSHGKKVLTDYSVIGIPGDGRCLFRSVAHGACIRSGKPAPNENLQRELADELRARVADEFVKRREETEWFIEGDFETYVSQIRKPHVWGGEPELLMASHVLQMPITVYMLDEESGALISIAEYGQEYGKDNPIIVLYHGFGHYDALHVPGKGGQRPRL